jgi:hypothetical protein
MRAHRVFISYSHRDEQWKDRLVAHLRVVARKGEVDAWDDRRIAAGAAWKADIERAIAGADIAILLISADFLTSPFIQDEEVARILQRRSSGLRIIPVIVRPCAWTAVEWLRDLQARPLDARPLSAAEDHEAEADLAALALEVFPRRWDVGPEGLRWATRAASILPVALAGAFIVVSSSIKVATPLQLDIVARSVSFTVAGESRVQLLNNSTAFSRLAIEQCESVTFPPLSIGTLEGEAPAAGGLTFHCDARVPGAKVVVRAPHGGAGSPQSPQPVATLGRITADPGDRVSLAMTSATPPEIWLEVSRAASFDFTIDRDVPFEIVSEFAEVEGLPPADGRSDIATYPVSLAASSTVRLATANSRRGLSIVLEPAHAADVEELFRADVDIPLESVSLFERGDDDQLVSTAIAGTLTYPGRDEIPGIQVRAGESVQLGDLEGFRLRQLRVDPENAGLTFRFQGTAADVEVGSVDRRLTLLDRAFGRNLKIAGLVATVVVQWAWLRRRPRFSLRRTASR